MNSSKMYAYLLLGLSAVLSIADSVHTIIPQPWGNLISGILGVAAYYHVYQSHTEAALGAAGYEKKY